MPVCLVAAALIACTGSLTAHKNDVTPGQTSVHTQTSDTLSAIEVDLTINGVSSGTSETRVLSLLGKPNEIKKGAEDVCAGGYHRYLIYGGLTIDVLSDGRGRQYAVTHIEVTSGKWDIAPGTHIGDSLSKVREAYGEPISQDKDSLQYMTRGNEGWVHFRFNDGTLVRVEMTETLC
jgi:hypothetical protein